MNLTNTIVTDITLHAKGSAGCRAYETPYLGPEEGRPGSPTQAHSHKLSTLIIMSGIALKQKVFKFKIAPHKQKSIVKIFFWQEDRPPSSWPTGSCA